MNQSEPNASIVWTGGPFTTTANNIASDSKGSSAGIRRLARGVIWLAIHDLGAWCRKCPHGKCECRQRREGAALFLRGEEDFGAISTLEWWATLADWPHEAIRQYFSERNKRAWIRFVIRVRAPYRRARRGASAPVEASFVDLLLAHSGGKHIDFPMVNPPFELTTS